jgi:hypothetical protein
VEQRIGSTGARQRRLVQGGARELHHTTGGGVAHARNRDHQHLLARVAHAQWVSAVADPF